MKDQICEENYSVTAQKRAQKYVKRLKAWYWLIPMNLLVTTILSVISFLMYKNNEPITIVWIMMSSAISLWVIFIVEGIVLKKPKVIRFWEARQIRKYLEKY